MVEWVVGEADHLVLKGGAVARADSLDCTRIHRASLEILLDDSPRLVGGARQMAAAGFQPDLVEEGEGATVVAPEGESLPRVVGGLDFH